MVRPSGNTNPSGAAADAPGLVEPPAAVLAGIGGMDQQLNLALARRGFDPLGAGDQRAAARFKAEPVERLLAQRRLDPLAEVGGNVDAHRS